MYRLVFLYYYASGKSKMHALCFEKIREYFFFQLKEASWGLTRNAQLKMVALQQQHNLGNATFVTSHDQRGAVSSAAIQTDATRMASLSQEHRQQWCLEHWVQLLWLYMFYEGLFIAVCNSTSVLYIRVQYWVLHMAWVLQV